MAKWADYLISAVQFNARHTHIDKVRQHQDNGETVGPGTVVARASVVAAIKNGVTYSSMFKGHDDKWLKGQPVFVVTINGVDYLKTRRDNTTLDNLDDLPEF